MCVRAIVFRKYLVLLDFHILPVHDTVEFGVSRIQHRKPGKLKYINLK